MGYRSSWIDTTRFEHPGDCLTTNKNHGHLLAMAGTINALGCGRRGTLGANLNPNQYQPANQPWLPTNEGTHRNATTFQWSDLAQAQHRRAAVEDAWAPAA